jgi:hypothetical protein
MTRQHLLWCNYYTNLRLLFRRKSHREDSKLNFDRLLCTPFLDVDHSTCKMRTPPLSVVASWPAPNYKNPETRGPANVIVGSILLFLTALVVALRLYTRKCISYGFGWDDILIMVAWLPAAGFTIVAMVSEFVLGFNRHVWDVPPQFIAPGLQITSVCSRRWCENWTGRTDSCRLANLALFDVATTLTKLSMLSLLYRLGITSYHAFCLIVLILFVFISVNCLIFMVILLTQCQ